MARARLYGDRARDALKAFPASPMKHALLQVVDFCIAGRTELPGASDGQAAAWRWPAAERGPRVRARRAPTFRTETAQSRSGPIVGPLCEKTVGGGLVHGPAEEVALTIGAALAGKPINAGPALDALGHWMLRLRAIATMALTMA